MLQFVPDLDCFPRLAQSGLTRRQIAERAKDEAAFKLLRTTYDTRPKALDHYACLYFVGPAHDAVCKIGIAKQPYLRLAGLQTGCWDDLVIHALFWYPSIDHAARHEADALKLAKQEGVWRRGEWVDLDHREAIGLALEAAGKDRLMTDTHGLFHDWLSLLPDMKRKQEDAFFEEARKRRAAKKAA